MERRDSLDVPNRAVDDDTTELLRRGGPAHQVTEDCRCRAADGIHDDNVARLRDVERFVNHEIVGGPAKHGHRGSTQREPATRSDARVHEIEPSHRVGDVRARHATEARDNRVSDAWWRWKNTKS